MMRRAVLAVAALVTLAAPAFAGTLDGASATGYQPRVPISAFARPLAWFDSSRLHMTHSVSVGSGMSGSTSALQTTEFSYAFRAPLTMKLSVGNTLGTAAGQTGSGFFLQGLDLSYQPTSHSMFRVQFQNVRSPLQYGPGSANQFGHSYWGD